MSRKDRVDWAEVSDAQSSHESKQKQFASCSKHCHTQPTIPSVTQIKPSDSDLINSINSIDTQYIYLCLLGVAFEASLQDIRNYFASIGSPIIRFVPQKNKRVYVIQLAKSNALKAAHIQPHVLKQREFIIKVDREKHYLGRVRSKGRNYRQKSQPHQCIKSKTSSTVQHSQLKGEIESQLMQAYRNAQINEQNLQIIRLVKAKYQSLLAQK